MEPNAIFFFLFLLLFFLLTLVNMIALSGKIMRLNIQGVFKMLLIAAMFGLLVMGLISFFGNSEGNFTVGYLLIFYAAAIPGLNWGLNLSKKFTQKNKKTAAVLFTIGFTILLPLILIGLIKLFDQLDILPPG